MKMIESGEFGNVYEIDTNTNTVVNAQTRVAVTREWAYPVKQAVWGGVPETYYFRTAAEREEYMRANNYCDKLPRCKIYSDCFRDALGGDEQ